MKSCADHAAQRAPDQGKLRDSWVTQRRLPAATTNRAKSVFESLRPFPDPGIRKFPFKQNLG